jgi:uncharacterized protein (TIGR01777 family)
MIVTLTGATGFIGKRLVQRLRDERHEVRIVSRGSNGSYTWDRIEEAVNGADGVVNLAGEPVSQRWNDAVKRRIRDSRIQSTRQVVQAIGKASRRPRVLVSASAIGYYGSRGDEILNESSAPGEGFLPEVCVAWEREANAASQLNVRVVLPRIGIVLGAGGGMLKSVLLPFKAGLGGKLASGEQWMSWIHVDDLVEMILLALTKGDVRGPMNGVSPQPVRNADFTAALGRALHRPTIFPTPAIALKLVFGEMAGVILSSARVQPAAAQNAGFQHQYPDLSQAFANILPQTKYFISERG